MIIHPEQNDDEIFLGNSRETKLPEHLSALKTIRFGKVAYDIAGHSIQELGYRPMLINKSELPLYDRIMMERTFGVGYRG